MRQKRMIRSLIVLVPVSLLTGCGFLPSGGPTAGDVGHRAGKTPSVDLVHVTPSKARQQMNKLQSRLKAQAQHTVHQLQSSKPHPHVRLAAGDKVDIKLWTVSPWPRQGEKVAATAPHAIKLGSFVVGNNGQVDLPYIKPIAVSGLRPNQAAHRIAHAYDNRGILQSPSATIRIKKNRGQQVIVAGEAKKPQAVSWSAGGLSLSQAIAQARGSRSSAIKNNKNGKSLNVAVLVRKGQRYKIPLKNAASSNIPLLPGDKVVLEFEPFAKVQFIGPGLKKSGVVTFKKTPTLSRGLAEDGGLSKTAQGKSVYVLRTPVHGPAKIFKFAWDSTAGLQAAQNFPLIDGDIVYVANAPSVKTRRLTNLLFNTVFPISTIKSVGGF